MKRLRGGQAAEDALSPVPPEAPQADIDLAGQEPSPAVEAAPDAPDTVQPEVHANGVGGAPVVPVSPRRLLAAGELAAARAALAGEAAAEAGLAALIDALAEGGQVLRELGLGATGSAMSGGIMLAPGDRSRGLLVVFGEDGGDFALPRALEEGGRPHLLFVRDRERCLSMLGVDGLGADYDSCLLAMLRLARRLEVRDIFCLGGDAAAYSALRYGLDLGAAGVLALGTVARLDPAARPSAVARQRKRLARLAAQLGPDLEQAYIQAAARPGLVLCRSESAATPLASLKGVTLHQAPTGAQGRMLDWAEESGQLRAMLRDALACRAVG
jgi:hypothetical protein